MMASRIFAPRLSTSTRFAVPSTRISLRTFQTSRRLLQDAPVVVKKPVGAFRGGLFGFLLGTSLAGASVYYYILEEYRIANTMLAEDIYALQATVQKLHLKITEMESSSAQQVLKK